MEQDINTKLNQVKELIQSGMAKGKAIRSAGISPSYYYMLTRKTNTGIKIKRRRRSRPEIIEIPVTPATNSVTTLCMFRGSAEDIAKIAKEFV